MPLTKVSEVTLFAIASIASNASTYGAAVDVSTYYEVDVRIRMGRGTGTAFTTSPIIRIEKTYKASPTVNDWVSHVEFQPAVGATLASQAVSGTVNAGATSILLAAGTNFGAADYVFCHNTTIANSEWVRVLSISSATITIEDAGLVNAQTGSTCRDQSEQYTAVISCTSIQKLRLVVDANSSGQACVVEAAFGAVSGL